MKPLASNVQPPNASQPPKRAAKRRKGKKRALPYLVLVLLGILLLLYPLIATWISDNELNKIAATYANEVQVDKAKQQADAIFKAAQKYNQDLAVKGRKPMQDDPKDPDFQNYLKQLLIPGGSKVMATIRIPAINVSLPIYHTVSPNVLYHGAGHMYGSDLPVGGRGTNAVISAHTGMVDATMFDELPNLKPGDAIFINVMGHELVYRMVRSQVVKPNDYRAIKFDPTKDQLTLITCTPYGLNTDRLLVTAERIYPVPKNILDQNKKDIKPQVRIATWMWIDMAIVIAALAMLLWLLFGKRRKKPENASTHQLKHD